MGRRNTCSKTTRKAFSIQASFASSDPSGTASWLSVLDYSRTFRFSTRKRCPLLFSALVYSLTMFVRQEPALAMTLSVYVTLGVFLLLAARNPSANRSLIAFTAWSSFAHAALMAVQAFRNFVARGELLGVGVLVIIGVALIALVPGKQSVERESAALIQTSRS
jgi:hypothetical protein